MIAGVQTEPGAVAALSPTMRPFFSVTPPRMQIAVAQGDLHLLLRFRPPGRHRILRLLPGMNRAWRCGRPLARLEGAPGDHHRLHMRQRLGMAPKRTVERFQRHGNLLIQRGESPNIMRTVEPLNPL